MPGLIGFSDKNHIYNINILSKMRNLLKHEDCYIDDELFTDGLIFGSRTHLGILDKNKQPSNISNQMISWMHGEIYNQDDLISKYNVDSESDNTLLLNIYKNEKSFEFLKDIDGYYCAVIYEKESNCIHLISDRFGLKPLYWGVIKNNIIWSSELKGFLGHQHFSPIINDCAVREFFNFGQLLENCTWFKGIELIPASTVISYNIKNSNINFFRYWSWKEIKQTPHNSINEKDLIEDLGNVFIKSIEKRITKEKRIGVSLSGGLDSRAILAAIPSNNQQIHTFTIGQQNCRDIKIAQIVSKIKKSNHHIGNIDEISWLQDRPYGVWISEGNVSLLHTHGVESLQIMKNSFDISLNGYAGDLVLGGSFLRRNYLDKEINNKIISNCLNGSMEINNFDDWYQIRKTDPYFINNRVRRFTNCGVIMAETLIEHRKPFFDNQLIELAYSIPDIYRYKSHIYNKMLLKFFPEFYNNVPYQKTGCPISYPKSLIALYIFKDRFIIGTRKIFNSFGNINKFKNLNNFVDYNQWVKTKHFKSFFLNVMNNRNAIYKDYVPSSYINKTLVAQSFDKVSVNKICLYLTFEIWLQQIFNKNYRSREIN